MIDAKETIIEWWRDKHHWHCAFTRFWVFRYSWGTSNQGVPKHFCITEQQLEEFRGTRYIEQQPPPYRTNNNNEIYNGGISDCWFVSLWRERSGGESYRFRTKTATKTIRWNNNSKRTQIVLATSDVVSTDVVGVSRHNHRQILTYNACTNWYFPQCLGLPCRGRDDPLRCSLSLDNTAPSSSCFHR